ncbi:hypothetical protein PND93_09320 [Faecalicoccus pleomorphus]|nr:hypothetical protein [Faecalicoccus pleomorphus]
MLDVFLELLDNISDEIIKNYLYAVGQFKLPSNIDTPNTQIIYFYGGKINEFVFRNVAKQNISRKIIKILQLFV